MNNQNRRFGKTCLSFAVASASVIVVTPLWAADKSSDEIEIVITAGRKAQSINNTLAPVSIITRQDIERFQASTVPEILSTLPGLSVLSSGGGAGKQTSLYLRGTNANHTLVLVDGVKIGSATLGGSALQLLPLDQIERIEVVRGPRSSLYGSEAIGGVIQIFTRRTNPKGQGFVPQASISYGSHNTRKVSANWSGGNDQAWFNVGLAHEKSDGINVLASYTDYPAPDYNPVTVRETDKDAYSNNSLSLRAGYRFANDINIELSFLNAEGDTEFDGGFVNETEFRQQVISTKLSVPVARWGNMTAQLGQSRDDSDQYKDGAYRNTFDTKRNTASLQMDSHWGAQGKLTVGVDYQDDKVGSNTTYSITSRDNTGLFASYQNRFAANSLDVSLRRDDNEQFGNKTTGAIALAHDWGRDLQARLSYGTAFKAPTFNDLYYPNSGNPELSPEKSRNIELGFSGQFGEQGNWGINAFQNNIDDLIEWQDTGNGVWKPMNVSAVRIRGLELLMNTQVAAWQVAANATLQKPQVSSGSNDGKRLIYRPEKLLNLTVDRDFGRWSVGATVHAEGNRATDVGNTHYLGGFATLDMRAAYALNRSVSLGLKVNNILDKDYTLKRNYYQDGINGLLTLEYRPQ
ncbi:MAG: TonB-dependent vitamin B12 receptor [Proteobacteria bacterium]|nr:MAG: TonB-dependent vitamin B12 receptor [Pseudomonadota bacterium]